MEETLFCTISTPNYFGLTKTLYKSLKKQHPEAKFATVLVEDVSGKYDFSNEEFDVTSIFDLNLSSIQPLAFKYNIVELSTSLKPPVIKYFIEKYNPKYIVYLDSDLYFFNKIDLVLKKIKRTDVILTPHILSPLPQDIFTPKEINILQSGTYNLGFLALRVNKKTRKLLDWWEDRLRDFALIDHPSGYFTDQKWMDFVPSFIDKVTVLRNPGYNVAYWNLHERKNLIKDNKKYYIGEDPLVFFHFSSFPTKEIGKISRCQNRFELKFLPKTYQELVAYYSEELRKNGNEKYAALPASFSKFDNGVEIPPIVRRIYYSITDKDRFGNPFDTNFSKCLFGWLRAPYKPGSYVTHLLHEIYIRDKDIQILFPHIETEKAEIELCLWANENLKEKYSIPQELFYFEPPEHKEEKPKLMARIFEKIGKIAIKIGRLIW